MELEIKYYDLPDLKAISELSDSGNIFVWKPDKVYLVLGRASKAEASLYKDCVLSDRIEVLKRPSGGETVLLSPAMIVFSGSLPFFKETSTKQVFREINKSLINQLTGLGVKNLYSKGISDISIGEKKIVGSSMYLNKGTLFYHAVMNVSEDVSLISRYIKHPPREPDYRKGRNHDEFVTSLSKEGYNFEFSLLEATIYKALKEVFLKN